MSAPRPPEPPGQQPPGQHAGQPTSPSAGPAQVPGGTIGRGGPGRGGTPDPARELAAARRAARRAQVLAAGAVVVALVAAVMSIVALARGSSAGEPGAPAAIGPTTAGQTPGPITRTGGSGPASTTGATQPSSVDNDRVVPEADFRPAYDGQRLTVQPPSNGCEQSRFVDVDEPRAGAPQEFAEFSYGRDCGGGAKAEIDILPADVSISTGGPNDDARDCVESIRNGPINEPLVPSPAMALCMLTSPQMARDEGNTRKVVLIVIDDIKEDGTMTVSLTAWHVPR